MALVEATVVATVKTEIDAAYGAATGDADLERDKICEAIGKAIITILSSQMIVTVPAGITTNGGTFPPAVGAIS